jgi:hypothetical protein
MLNIEKLVSVLGWRGEVVGVGARHDGRLGGVGGGQGEGVGIERGWRWRREVRGWLPSGQRRNVNVGNLELQPVTCDRVRGERAFSQLRRIRRIVSLFDLYSQRITFFPSPPSF